MGKKPKLRGSSEYKKNRKSSSILSFEAYQSAQAALLDTPPLVWLGLAKVDVVLILFWQCYKCSVGRARWKGYTQSRVVGGGKQNNR